MRFSPRLLQTKRVVCGMSGGVDSAVAALILKRKGYDVVGLFMKNWDSANEHGVCMADLDRDDAKHVCDVLRIPLYEVNFVKEYWNDVFSDFIKDLKKGYTPNPDVLCNKYIKFKAFHEYAIQYFNADATASGHYARTTVGFDIDSINQTKGVELLKAVDYTKCQTLFLSQVPQKALQKHIFPLGELLKKNVKKIARDNGLEKIANKRESVGICFIGKRNFHDFIEDYVEPLGGDVVHHETGKVLTTHKGLHMWTLGQRFTGGLGGQPKPLFVSEKNTQTNVLKVVHGSLHPALFTQIIFTEVPHWINKPPRELLTNQMFDATFRYQHIQLSGSEVKCTVTLSGGNSLIVSLENPRRCIAPGQFAVFYQGDICLGSAKIRGTGPSLYTMGQREDLSEYIPSQSLAL